ncbi:MAG: SIS domain-containing protein [Pseudomonadota bacterium]
MDAKGDFKLREHVKLPEADTNFFADYGHRLNTLLEEMDWTPVQELANDLISCWAEKRQVFICGNGGSAANAVHMANDFIYGISKIKGKGLRVDALTSNGAVITCLANDEGYDEIFATQLEVKANPDDLLIVLSGSGNSRNILKALTKAKDIGVKSYGILGFTGGKAKELADVPIHFAIDDMQISEDTQMMVAHMIMQWLYQNHEYVTSEVVNHAA